MNSCGIGESANVLLRESMLLEKKSKRIQQNKKLEDMINIIKIS
jgi:hypothetical protein